MQINQVHKYVWRKFQQVHDHVVLVDHTINRQRRTIL